jgi:hypothetical protein
MVLLLGLAACFCTWAQAESAHGLSAVSAAEDREICSTAEPDSSQRHSIALLQRETTFIGEKQKQNLLQREARHAEGSHLVGSSQKKRRSKVSLAEEETILRRLMSSLGLVEAESKKTSEQTGEWEPWLSHQEPVGSKDGAAGVAGVAAYVQQQALASQASQATDSASGEHNSAEHADGKHDSPEIFERDHSDDAPPSASQLVEQSEHASASQPVERREAYVDDNSGSAAAALLSSADVARLGTFFKAKANATKANASSLARKEITKEEAEVLSRQVRAALYDSILDVVAGFELGPGTTSPLDEDGYSSVAALKDMQQMEFFTRRLISQMGIRVRDQGGLQGIMPFYDGETSKQSFSALKDELQKTSKATGAWVTDEASGASAPLSPEGYQQVAKLDDTREMAEFVRRAVSDLGLTVEDEGGLQGLSPWHSGDKAQSFDDLQGELVNASKTNGTWITQGKPCPGTGHPSDEQLDEIQDNSSRWTSSPNSSAKNHSVKSNKSTSEHSKHNVSSGHHSTAEDDGKEQSSSNSTKSKSQEHEYVEHSAKRRKEVSSTKSEGAGTDARTTTHTTSNKSSANGTEDQADDSSTKSEGVEADDSSKNRADVSSTKSEGAGIDTRTMTHTTSNKSSARGTVIKDRAEDSSHKSHANTSKVLSNQNSTEQRVRVVEVDKHVVAAESQAEKDDVPKAESSVI